MVVRVGEMAIKTITKSFFIGKQMVEGAKLEWEGFSLLILTAPKGFLACGIFDLEALDRVDTEVGFEVEIEVEHVGGVARALAVSGQSGI